MNGDEDLGEDIIMKGKPFHYNQKQKPQQLFATGMNGDEDLGEDIIMKGKPFHYEQKPAANKLFATGMNGDEDLGEDIIMKGKPFHYNQKLAQEAPEEGSEAEEKAEAKEEEKMKEADAKANKAAVKNVAPAEKVSVLETAIAKEHTTFYDKKAPKKDDLVQLNWVELRDCDGTPGEKVLSGGNASWATCKPNPKISYTGKK